MTRRWVFDMPHATRLTEARISFLQDWLPHLVRSLGLRTALDVGCGVGYFSRYLTDLGLHVVAIDGRPENISEAQRRSAQVTFLVQNVEDPTMRRLGQFDLVCCVGLLYHLENPFLAIRHLAAVTQRVLLVESCYVPGSSMTAAIVEEREGEDQSMNYIALVPSSACFIKMFYRAGFSFVYTATRLPRHRDFRTTLLARQRRTFFLASNIPLSLAWFHSVPEPASGEPWRTPWAAYTHRVRNSFNRFRSVRNVGG
jgi:SAM-dependent methyltransferase